MLASHSLPAQTTAGKSLHASSGIIYPSYRQYICSLCHNIGGHRPYSRLQLPQYSH